MQLRILLALSLVHCAPSVHQILTRESDLIGVQTAQPYDGKRRQSAAEAIAHLRDLKKSGAVEEVYTAPGYFATSGIKKGEFEVLEFWYSPSDNPWHELHKWLIAAVIRWPEGVTTSEKQSQYIQNGFDRNKLLFVVQRTHCVLPERVCPRFTPVYEMRYNFQFAGVRHEQMEIIYRGKPLPIEGAITLLLPNEVEALLAKARAANPTRASLLAELMGLDGGVLSTKVLGKGGELHAGSRTALAQLDGQLAGATGEGLAFVQKARAVLGLAAGLRSLDVILSSSQTAALDAIAAKEQALAPALAAKAASDGRVATALALCGADKPNCAAQKTAVLATIDKLVPSVTAASDRAEVVRKVGQRLYVDRLGIDTLNVKTTSPHTHSRSRSTQRRCCRAGSKTVRPSSTAQGKCACPIPSTPPT